MKTLHSRYSKKYDVDVVENIKTIKAVGVRNFIKQEEKKWLCKSCGGLVSMHRDNCLRCGAKKEL
ncbi:hypothetical protein JW887_05915 [Candidatus Dojkabacteria bacterium]|nr:hypothetical protein [Candidatus Dojkabacteria bacterium]